MATQTPNYNLTKPDPNTDYYNIEVHNNNADIVDEALKGLDTKFENIEVPVTSVNNKTGAVVLNADDVGAETPTGAQAKVNAHANATNNPHNVTKSDVGLGSVQNYDLATQAEAEAGTSSAKYMTPLRTKQAVNALQAVKSVAGKTGAVALSKSDVGLGDVDNAKQATKVEFDEHKADIASQLGTVELATTDQTLKGAINEVFTSGNNVKANTVGALLSVDENLPITTESAWADVINAIGQISTGKKFASGYQTSAKQGSNTYPSIIISGLDFIPKTIITYMLMDTGIISFTLYTDEFDSRNALFGGFLLRLETRIFYTGSTMEEPAAVKLTSGIINEDGAKIVVGKNGKRVDWIAFE